MKEAMYRKFLRPGEWGTSLETSYSWDPDEDGGYVFAAGDGVLLKVIAGCSAGGLVQWQVTDTLGDLCVTGDASSVELAKRRAERCLLILVMEIGVDRWRLANNMTVAEAVAYVEGEVR